VVERGGGAGLVEQTAARIRIRHSLGRDELDRDLAIERDIVGEVDLAHAATAKEPTEAVASEVRFSGSW